MPSTNRRLVVRAALLVALLAPVWGCANGDGSAAPDGPADGKPSPERPATPGLGRILVGGRAVTGSEPSGNAKVPYRRTYTDGELYAPVTGYRSTAFGAAGLEGVYGDELTAGVSGGGRTSGDVTTTIDPSVQRAAMEGLRGHKGAAVALDAGTGQLLAVASTPSYDPGRFSGNTTADTEAWKRLMRDPDKPMLNRALREALAPEGTFGVVVAAAALERGLYASVDDSTRSPAPYTAPGSASEFSDDPAHCRNASIRNALRHGCHNVFAAMAVEMGQPAVAAMAEAFGFNGEELRTPVRLEASVYPRSGVNGADVAFAGAGLGGVTATPVQMARVVAAVANGGERVDPQMVAKVVRADGSVVKPAEDAARRAKRIMRRGTAEQLRSALETSAAGARAGGGTGAVIGGTSGRVTPSPSYGDGATAWFVSYARTGEGGLIACAVRITDADGGAGEPAGSAPAVRVAELMGRATA
ncbi:penicillin-binding transpeptidase domain-containing protein [Streptomyces sp. NPDC005803]|uniref:penicillin-binding transpeptidase domain-containing protein n=1 Tax=Streptomyces sp. NPDC005803 TaxID=3154297 RepID=UPI0033D6A87A